MTDAQLVACHEWAEASAVAQGLTARVTDPAAIERIATIMRPPAARRAVS
jgi:hypothetical protein